MGSCKGVLDMSFTRCGRCGVPKRIAFMHAQSPLQGAA